MVDYFGITNLTLTAGAGSTVWDNRFFHRHPNLWRLTVQEGVTSLNRFTFALCTNLTSVTLPSTLTSIGDRAFEGCVKLPNLPAVRK